MKRLLFLLLLSFILTNNIIHANTNNDSSKLEVKLRTILKNLKKFKNDKNSEIAKLNEALKEIKEEFTLYKKSKETQVDKLKAELSKTKKELLVQTDTHKEENIQIETPILTHDYQIITDEENLESAVEIAMQKAMDTPLLSYASETEVEIVIK